MAATATTTATTTATATATAGAVGAPWSFRRHFRSLSTGAAAAAFSVDDDGSDNGEATSKKKTGKRRNNNPKLRGMDKDPIIVTDRAADRIKELLEGENARGAVGIRLGVRRRGCNGLSYTLDYAFPENDDDNKAERRKDITMETHGIKVFIEPMALFSVVGTTMDWEETELTSEFTFHNPNSKGECGCGESFTV